jgi:hypothetical protein
MAHREKIVVRSIADFVTGAFAKPAGLEKNVVADFRNRR